MECIQKHFYAPNINNLAKKQDININYDESSYAQYIRNHKILVYECTSEKIKYAYKLTVLKKPAV